MTLTANVVQSKLPNTTFSKECQRYDLIREEMINEISRYCMPSSNCLLFGDEHLNHNCNLAIFNVVQQYISDSKRFKS